MPPAAGTAGLCHSQGRLDLACAQPDGDPKKGYGAQGPGSLSSAKPPLASDAGLSPSTSVEEKHLPRPQVSGAEEGGLSWPRQRGSADGQNEISKTRPPQT